MVKVNKEIPRCDSNETDEAIIGDLRREIIALSKEQSLGE